MSDWTGRKPVLGLADIIFMAGAIGQAVCHDVWSMVSYVRSELHAQPHVVWPDWMPLPDWCRSWVGILHCSTLHPGTIPDETTRPYGRPQRHHDYIGSGEPPVTYTNADLDASRSLHTESMPVSQMLPMDGATWLDWVPSPQAFNSDCFFSFRNRVSMACMKKFYQDIAIRCLLRVNAARILVRRGDIEGAHKIMTRIYAHAKPEQVDLKVCICHLHDPPSLTHVSAGQSPPRSCATKY